ncbi:CapA family protein [Flammeovirga sp. EKP202]|uniref:CapA family protein n=1 Tax=Flammeovirga sp. EKP202 TaxID=2770592 RepID=UPI00166003B0|nr:CapA family protein [Flammeovirga sp. EKP202]MBD0403032.1 CapA family protein [Flammeovirga sp. EKP202]
MIQVVKIYLLIAFLGIGITNVYAQVSFCAVGDVLLDRDVKKVIKANGIQFPFNNVEALINGKDLAFFNMECPLANASDGYPINKRYSFRAEPEYIQGLKFAGFNIASVANNHTIDLGKEGFLKTIENLNAGSIYTIGGGKNQEEAFRPLLLEKNGETFAFFGMLEFLLEGTIFNENKPYPAYGQIDRLCNEIKKINSDIDHIIISFHWGQESAVIPTSKQIEYAHKVIDAGADLVLGHHPHVLQSIETYKGKLILYSLGNFVFDNSAKLQKESVIFNCQFQNGQILNPELIPIYIDNCQPKIASKGIKKDILNHLNKVSNQFNTTFTLKGNSIKIDYQFEKPIKELDTSSHRFSIFKDKIVTYNSFNEAIQYSLPDSDFILVDADVFTTEKGIYIYSIVQNTINHKSRIAIFPFSVEKNEFLKPSLDSHESFNPWKIKVFDVDKDGNPEVIVGVNKSTRYYSEKENRVFVFNTDNDYFYPKWLGSKIGNPIVDFKVCSKTNRLIVLERSKVKNTNMVVSYKWNGFGFDNDKILNEFGSDTDLNINFKLSDYDFKTIL